VANTILPGRITMDAVPFTDRFQLLDLKRDEGARSFEAREIATGRPVLAHIFENRTAPLTRILLAKIDTLPEAERARIIERGDHEAGVYIITDRLIEYAGLREWLTQKKMDVPPPPPPPLPTGKPTVDAQLANLFDTAPLPALEKSPTDPPTAPVLTDTGIATMVMPKYEPPVPPPILAPPPPPPVAKPAEPDPGEFTRQFAPVIRPAPLPTPPPAASEPGEFTSQFAPVQRPAAPPAQPAATANDPGEFTRQFAPVQRPPQRPATAEQPMGEFTRQFQAPVRPISKQAQPTAPPASPGTKEDGEFTQMLKAQPMRPASAPPSQPPIQPPTIQQVRSPDFDNYFQSAPPPPAPNTAQTFRPLSPPTIRQERDGEFTQIFGPGDVAAPRPPSAPPASGPPTSSNATQVFIVPPQPPTQVQSQQHQSPLTQQYQSPPTTNSRPALNLPPTSSPTTGREEWGRMFDAPAALTFGQAPPTDRGLRLQDVAPQVRNTSKLPLLLIVSAVVLLVIAVIVYFVMRPH
jgi:hypothetical protein